MARLGLIAGNGNFPLLLAQSYKKNPANEIVAVGFKGDTSSELQNTVDHFEWVGVGQLGRIIKIFNTRNITEALMAGQITPTRLFDKIKFDFKGLSVFTRLKDKKADTIFTAVADELKKAGIQLLDSTTFISDQLAQPGFLTRRPPNPDQSADIEFGRHIAKELGRLDIGQTIVVKGKAVLAVEALEGTNETILRGGRLGKADVVVIKTAKPHQDMRFDVPVVGAGTIETMIQAGASCLAVEAGQTLILDRDHVIDLANRHDITIVGF